MSNHFPTIDAAVLLTVSGGVTASGEVRTPLVRAKGEVKTDPQAAPDPEKQLRCYRQVADQAHWYQPSKETLKQQLSLCGPLRP